jgi:hypothetical protein
MIWGTRVLFTQPKRVRASGDIERSVTAFARGMAV